MDSERKVGLMMKKKFMTYVSLNVLGTLGISLYILADSYFISVAEGARGLAALNLVLPVYNLIFAIGAMIGVGSAIRYTIEHAKGEKRADGYLFQAFFFAGIIGAVFILIGLFFPDALLKLLGGNEQILEIGVPYTRIFMLFSPVFMWNHIMTAFVRNDGAPSIAMAATLSSSLFNIVFDYVLMFPLGMGMEGAALATALSPVLGISICMIHFFQKNCSISFRIVKPSLGSLMRCCQVGISAFVGEMSSGVITMTFNYIILAISHNVGVAAYGIVANIALVAVAVFNGISQGSQPLISEEYARGQMEKVKTLKSLSLLTAFVMAILIYGLIFLFTDEIIQFFNSENSKELAEYAFVGVRVYFIGIFFSGLNIVGSSYFSATEQAREAFIVSILRGFVLILICAFVFSFLFQMLGVWLAYVVAEGLTCLIMLILLEKRRC